MIPRYLPGRLRSPFLGRMLRRHCSQPAGASSDSQKACTICRTSAKPSAVAPSAFHRPAGSPDTPGAVGHRHSRLSAVWSSASVGSPSRPDTTSRCCTRSSTDESKVGTHAAVQLLEVDGIDEDGCVLLWRGGLKAASEPSGASAYLGGSSLKMPNLSGSRHRCSFTVVQSTADRR